VACYSGLAAEHRNKHLFIGVFGTFRNGTRPVFSAFLVHLTPDGSDGGGIKRHKATRGVEWRHAKRGLSAEKLPSLAHAGTVGGVGAVAKRNGSTVWDDATTGAYGPKESRVPGVS